MDKSTINTEYPLLRIEDLFYHVKGVFIFSKNDLRSGYQQIRVKEEDIYKKKFRTRYGHYQFVLFPFGLTNAPTTFMSLMNNFILIFIDDIHIYSKKLKECQENLWIVLQTLRENQRYTKFNKCDVYKANSILGTHYFF